MTLCFHCKLTLRLWKADDNIWEEHARWNPKCQFVIMNKGEAFINEVKLKYAVVSLLECSLTMLTLKALYCFFI